MGFQSGTIGHNRAQPGRIVSESVLFLPVVYTGGPGPEFRPRPLEAVVVVPEFAGRFERRMRPLVGTTGGGSVGGPIEGRHPAGVGCQG